MKQTFKVYSSKALAVLLAVTMLMSCMSFGASAAVLGGVSGTEVVSTNYGGNIEYAHYSGTNADSYVAEFNPTTSNLMPMGYVQTAGSGKTMSEQIAAAKKDGYDVYGGINGEFFSMKGNVGTLTGRLIGNGRILSDGELNKEYGFVIGNDSSFNFAWSQLSYHFYVEGKEVGNSVIARINKAYGNDGWGYNPYCYFDSACGTMTDTVKEYKGVEVVFNKLNGSELVVEGILEGEVVSVTEDTYGTTFGEDQFVLYAWSGSAYYSSLADLVPGQKVQIYAEELIDESKDIMKNANTVMAATYPVVQNGVNCATMGPMTSVGELSVTEGRAQRTAIGVKADGTFVYFVSSGRVNGTPPYGPGPGLTIKEVGDAMVELGCVSAVNLDGGGSSVLNLNGENKYITENRPIGSVMLIVGRNEGVTSSTEKQALNDWIYNATSELNNGTYVDDQKDAVEEAIAYANAIYNDTNSTTGDYVRAVMDLREAMGLVEDVRPKTYITLEADAWSSSGDTLTLSNLADGSLVLDSTKEWPWSFCSLDITAPANAKIFYDFTGSAQVSIVLVCAGIGEVHLNEIIAPNNLDAGSGDIKANGARYTGTIDVSTLSADGLEISGLKFCTSAGGASTLTMHEFSIRTPFSSGDVDGDYEINSTDAREILRHTVSNKLSGNGLAAADANQDGGVNTSDIRFILEMSVGLKLLPWNRPSK